MAVRIRMKKMGRKHRPFFRICAIDSRNPRDGRVLEELGTYDPMVPETDARAVLNGERIAYWLGVGAQPSEKVKVLIKKYGTDGTHVGRSSRPRWRGWPDAPPSRAAAGRRPSRASRRAGRAAKQPAARPPSEQPRDGVAAATRRNVERSSEHAACVSTC